MPEGLELGELKVQNTTGFTELNPVYIIVFTGDTIGQQTIDQDGHTYNGISSSITYILCNNDGGLQACLNIINTYGQGDKILTVFSVPKLALLDKISSLEPDPNVHYYYYEILDYDYKQSEITKNLNSRPSSIDGYTPRNKKLLTYPYLYLGFNPQNGSQKIYKYENFTNGTPSFKIISEINPNPTVQFIPQNYRGASGNSLSDNCSMNGYPTISYKNDVFNTWLAQNGEIVNLQMQQEQFNYEISGIKEATNLFTNIATSGLGGYNMNSTQAGNGLLGSINSALNIVALEKNHDFYIKQQMAQIEKQKLLPDNASLSSSNSTLLGYNLLDDNIFTVYSIKAQFAERIDKFFDMYGYLTNQVKIPNTNNRPNWNYIKTIGCNIIGNIPQIDLESIKSMFDNGITLWHNPTTFLDYSQNNR